MPILNNDEIGKYDDADSILSRGVKNSWKYVPLIVIQRCNSKDSIGREFAEKAHREDAKKKGLPDSWFEFEKKLSDARDLFIEEYNRLCKEYGFENNKPTLYVKEIDPYNVGIYQQETILYSIEKMGC